MLFVDTADYSCLAKLREAGDQWQEQYANQKVTTALKVVLMSGLCVLLRSKVEELQQSEEHQARLIKVGWLSEGRTALDPVFHYYEWSPAEKKELRSAAQPLPLTEVLGMLDTLEQYLPIPGVLTQFKATRQWSEVHRSEDSEVTALPQPSTRGSPSPLSQLCPPVGKLSDEIAGDSTSSRTGTEEQHRPGAPRRLSCYELLRMGTAPRVAEADSRQQGEKSST